MTIVLYLPLSPSISFYLLLSPFNSFYLQNYCPPSPDHFGDIGARQGYNYYMRNPQRFTDLEIEATKNFIQSLINPKGEQGDDAE